MPTESFPDLIRRLRTGDQAALAELLRLYEPEIRRLVRLSLSDSKLRRVYESADIFQSVFANFYVRLVGGQFDLQEPGQMIRLLATMARKKVVDHARKLSNQGGAADSDLLAAIPDRGRSPSSVVASQEFLQKVQGLLTDEERLLAEERAEGQSWPELAARHGGTAESLRKKVERALDRVCEQLGTP